MEYGTIGSRLEESTSVLIFNTYGAGGFFINLHFSSSFPFLGGGFGDSKSVCVSIEGTLGPLTNPNI